MEGLFAEPLNLVTNAAFLVAAILIWRQIARDPRLSFTREWDVTLLAGVVFAIGLGSGAWHAWPITVTRLMDALPILIFILGFIWAFLVRGIGLKWYWALGFVLLFLATRHVPAALSMQPLRGSGAYLPALVALALASAWLFATRNPPHGKSILTALVLFSVSLSFRAIDGEVCEDFAPGTHFVWHLMNATVLYVLLASLARAAAGSREQATSRGEGARRGV